LVRAASGHYNQGSVAASGEIAMPSPFPGMNPYLEQDTVWHDFHERFCPVAAEMLTAQVRPHYIVKIDEHVYIHEPPEDPRRLLGRADVGLAETPRAGAPNSPEAASDTSVAVRLPAVDFERQSFVEIRDRNGRKLITVIELLSPSNKLPGPDREQYLAKRLQLIHSDVHVVELDLLRGGPRLPSEGLPPCDYCVLISRVQRRPEARVMTIHLRGPLPVVPIPLREEAQAHLDLKVVLDRIYDAAGYEDYLYEGEPQPRLGPEDAAWARQFVPVAR
jgi:Protein of unknown function (DUF4058)